MATLGQKLYKLGTKEIDGTVIVMVFLLIMAILVGTLWGITSVCDWWKAAPPKWVMQDVLKAWSKGDTAENHQDLLCDCKKANSDFDKTKWPSKLYSPTEWDAKSVQFGEEDDVDNPAYDAKYRKLKVETAKVTMFVKSSNEAGMPIQQLWEFKLLKNKDGKWGFSRVDEKDKK
jgi:hypothetical protein